MGRWPKVECGGKESDQESKGILTTPFLCCFSRRDTYQIFAAPVDLNLVPGYDVIIRNPMDFATMESKVQRGIYPDVESFKVSLP